MAFTSPVIKQSFFDNNGHPLSGGKLYTYEAGTSTPKDTYQDALGAALNTNPIILDANGQCDLFIRVADFYKFTLFDSNDVLQYSIDNISTPFNPDAPVTTVTNDMLATMDANRIKGRAGTSGTPVDLTPLQVNTLLSDSATDSTTTGADQTLSAITTKLLRLTNSSLTSIEMITQGYDAQVIFLENRTGNEIVLKNEVGATAARRIVVPTGADLDVSDKSVVLLVYSETSQRWIVVGGAGGGGLVESVNGFTGVVLLGLEHLTNTEFTSLAEGDVLVYDLANAKWINSTRLSDLEQDVSDIEGDLTAHTSNTSNPHSVTKTQVGLGNVDNTSDLNKPISTATQTALDAKFTNSVSTNKLLGRSTSGTGAVEEITLGDNLEFDGTTLNASGGGGGSGLSWYTADGYNSPDEGTITLSSFPMKTLNWMIVPDSPQYIFSTYQIPYSYKPGNRIALEKGTCFYAVPSGTYSAEFELKTMATVMDVAIAGTGDNTSVAGVQSTVDNALKEIPKLYLNDEDAEIDGVPCFPGQLLVLRLESRFVTEEFNPSYVYMPIDRNLNAFQVNLDAE